VRRFVFAFAVVLGACHHTPAPVIAELRVHMGAVVPASLPMPDEAKLIALVTNVVSAVPGALRIVTSPAADAPKLRMLVEVATAYRGDKIGTAVRARIEPLGDIAGLEVIDRDGLVEKEGQAIAPTAAELTAHLTHALELIAGGAVRGEDLWLAPPKDVQAALASSDGDLRDEAIRIAGERRARDSVPALILLLKVDDDATRDKVIGALGEIGDRRAAKPLSTLASLGDVEEVPKIVDALSLVGGPEAESYLEFVSASHSVPEVRAIAKRALEHLRARQGDGGVAPRP
jgi:hypothetical protein